MGESALGIPHFGSRYDDDDDDDDDYYYYYYYYYL